MHYKKKKSCGSASADGCVCVLAGTLSEEGLLLYLRALQTLLPLLPVSESHNRLEVGSDSEDEDDANIHAPSMQVQCINTRTF